MKKSSLSDSEIKLIVILLAIAMLSCAYFFGYNKNLKVAKQIEESNEAVRQDNVRLQGMIDRRQEIEDETTLLRARIKDVIAKYPVDVPTEKAIYLLQKMEEATGIHYPTIGFSMNNPVGGSEGTGLPAYYADLYLSYSAGYEDFKTTIDYVHDFDDRMNIPSASAVYDTSTGGLSGTITIRMYYLKDTDKEYERLPDLGIESGVNNIFGTGVADSVQQGGSQAAQGEE